MKNPTIIELQNSDKYELIAQLNHRQIKEFVIDQLSEGGWLIKSYMVYQVLMILIGVFFLVRSIIDAFQGFLAPIYYTFAALFFCFSVLIVIHELLHGTALKFIGAPKVTYGAYLKKFIFYAEADQFVINKKQFAAVALTPLLTIKLITITGIIILVNQPAYYFPLIIMCAHSLFCAGDIGLLSVFYKYGRSEIYTFDVKSDKTSFFFKTR